jgi:glycylpeptide N-tetradecanoyltransferase
MPPGWKRQWHIGIRVGSKLCAFFGGTPTELRVRRNTLPVAEWNFLCVHKDLRARGLAPALFTEMRRRCNLDGVWQAVFTGSDVIPTPVSSCPFYHRTLNWQKLYDVGFTYLPRNSTPEQEVEKQALPKTTVTEGLRHMEARDVGAVTSLLHQQLAKFSIAPQFKEVEVEHWLLHKGSADERFIWTYVVEVC